MVRKRQSAKSKRYRSFIAITYLGLLSATPAYAYIDPGTGAMLVQGLIALVASIVFYFKNPAQLFKLFRERLGYKALRDRIVNRKK